MADKEAAKPKYGIQELSDALGSKPNLVRIRLRRLGIKRADGKTYGWNSQAEMNEVIKTLEAKKTKAEKPAAKAAAKPAKKPLKKAA